MDQKILKSRHEELAELLSGINAKFEQVEKDTLNSFKLNTEIRQKLDCLAVDFDYSVVNNYTRDVSKANLENIMDVLNKMIQSSLVDLTTVQNESSSQILSTLNQNQEGFSTLLKVFREHFTELETNGASQIDLLK